MADDSHTDESQQRPSEEENSVWERFLNRRAVRGYLLHRIQARRRAAVKQLGSVLTRRLEMYGNLKKSESDAPKPKSSRRLYRRVISGQRP